MRSRDAAQSHCCWLINLLVVCVCLVWSSSLVGRSSPIAYSGADNAMEPSARSIATESYDVGANDFRISDMGLDGDIWSRIVAPSAITYNGQNNQYLVVWAANDDPTGPAHIYGQRLDAATGAEIGTNDFQINQTLLPSFLPDVTYNPIMNEYLVVWVSRDFRVSTPTTYGIFAQRLDAATGNHIGVDAFRIDVPASDPNYRLTMPDVTYNSTLNEYLVMWKSYQDEEYLEAEMIGQKLDATGALIGQQITSISDTPSIGFDVAYHAITNEYMVVWSIPEVDHITNVYVQRLDATTGAQVGANDVRISDMEAEEYFSFSPGTAIAYNETTGEYLVVWNTNVDAFNNYQIHGQRLNATGGEVGEDDFAISQVGSATVDFYLAGSPAIAHNPTTNQYLVVWDTYRYLLFVGDEQFDIYGQLLDGTTGAEIGINDVRISDLGHEDSTMYHANSPALVYNMQNDEYLVTWDGEDNTGTLIDDEMEIFGQRLAVPWDPTPTATPLPPTPTPTTTPPPTATSTPTPTTVPPTATPTTGVPTLTPTPGLPPIEPSRTFLPMIIR